MSYLLEKFQFNSSPSSPVKVAYTSLTFAFEKNYVCNIISSRTYRLHFDLFYNKEKEQWQRNDSSDEDNEQIILPGREYVCDSVHGQTHAHAHAHAHAKSEKK